MRTPSGYFIANNHLRPGLGTRPTVSAIIAAVCLFGSSHFAGAQRRQILVEKLPVASAEVPVGAVRFDIEFPGGTVQRLAEALGALQSGTVQVMYPRLLGYRVPAFSFHESLGYDAGRSSDQAKRELAQSLGSSFSFWSAETLVQFDLFLGGERLGTLGPAPVYAEDEGFRPRVVSVAGLAEKPGLEQLFGAIDLGLSTAKERDVVLLRYHPETQLLLLHSRQRPADLITNIVRALKGEETKTSPPPPQRYHGPRTYQAPFASAYADQVLPLPARTFPLRFEGGSFVAFETKFASSLPFRSRIACSGALRAAQLPKIEIEECTAEKLVAKLEEIGKSCNPRFLVRAYWDGEESGQDGFVLIADAVLPQGSFELDVYNLHPVLALHKLEQVSAAIQSCRTLFERGSEVPFNQTRYHTETGVLFVCGESKFRDAVKQIVKELTPPPQK